MDKQFPAAVEKLYDILEYISIYAIKAGFKVEVIKHIELALEEALVNIIVHGYENKPGRTISIILASTEKPGIEITIVDDGIPFKPGLSAAVLEPLSKDALDSKEGVGGFGLFLIHKMMDKVEYTRIEGKNVLKLKKYLESV